MRLVLAAPLLLALAGCHGMFGDRTDEEDAALNSFAEARQRAATYYDGGDYARAAAQYREALELRPDHFMSRLGLAYSLMRANTPTSLVSAEKEFQGIGERRDPKEEVKRVYGLGLTYGSLAAYYGRRSRLRESKGQVKGAAEDEALAMEYARKGIATLEKVFELDRLLARGEQVEPLRVSASLTPDAHVGIALCEVQLMDPSRPEEVQSHFEAAREHLLAFAEIAANARKFWETKRAQILVVDPLKEQASTATVDAATKQRYEERIANTLREEIAVRVALFDTLLFVNRFDEAIREADTILGLEPGRNDILLRRGRAYLFLDPPDRDAALRDLKEYRTRMQLDRLTDELVQLNRDIRRLEQEIEKSKAGAASGG